MSTTRTCVLRAPCPPRPVPPEDQYDKQLHIPRLCSIFAEIDLIGLPTTSFEGRNQLTGGSLARFMVNGLWRLHANEIRKGTVE